MTDDELVEIAKAMREGIVGTGSSAWMCAMVCWPLAGYLRFHGVDCDCVESDLGECNHIWIRLADGRALDPTADQFNRLFPDLAMPPVYLGAPMTIHSAEVGQYQRRTSA
ncbi:MAG: hypothetical protein WBA88_27370 [Pseudaminobacter sp.]